MQSVECRVPSAEGRGLSEREVTGDGVREASDEVRVTGSDG